MKSDNIARQRAARVWLAPEACDLSDFVRQTSRTTEPGLYPFAAEIVSNVPVYDGDAVRRCAGEGSSRAELLAEWAEAMLTGPGIIVIRRAFADAATVDAASEVFFAMIAEQRASGAAAGDHFAKPGANDRIWNALEKLALRAPEIFAAYYANWAIALASEAWLGPHYQITSQLNVVNPGGEAQSAHRDYHMGFQSEAEIARFPAHVHRLSPVMTLQGAVAHVDMPVESGPTLYLPYSQTFEPGYFAWRKPEFMDYFRSHHVQLPLAKGDAVFFSPALFHAAGTNRTADVRRMANLLQVSSAYGRAMEAVDRERMAAAVYPVLRQAGAAGTMTAADIANVIAACAEGYAFPTNLDRDPPLGGLAPASQADIMRKALAEGLSPSDFKASLRAHAARRQT